MTGLFGAHGVRTVDEVGVGRGDVAAKGEQVERSESHDSLIVVRKINRDVERSLGAFRDEGKR